LSDTYLFKCINEFLDEAIDVSVCDQFPEGVKAYCIVNLAQFKLEPAECENFDSPDERLNLLNRDKCLFNVAVREADSGLCKQFTSVIKRDLENSCYHDVAIETNDLKLCERVKMRDSRISCLINVAANKNDPSICVDKVSSSDKDFCYEGIAKVSKNLGYCQAISDQDLRDSCYSYIVKRL